MTNIFENQNGHILSKTKILFIQNLKYYLVDKALVLEENEKQHKQHHYTQKQF